LSCNVNARNRARRNDGHLPLERSEAGCTGLKTHQPQLICIREMLPEGEQCVPDADFLEFLQAGAAAEIVLGKFALVVFGGLIDEIEDLEDTRQLQAFGIAQGVEPVTKLFQRFVGIERR
jgi:hypothetical protein